MNHNEWPGAQMLAVASSMVPVSQAKGLGTAAIGQLGAKSRCLPPSRKWMPWVLSLVGDRARHTEPPTVGPRQFCGRAMSWM